MLGEKPKRAVAGRQRQIGAGEKSEAAGNARRFEAGRADWEDDSQGRNCGRAGLDGKDGRVGSVDIEKERSEKNERWRMTMPSKPTSAVPPTRAVAQQRYNQASELEKQLRALLQTKGPFDPTVRALRTRVCEGYESVVLEDHELAETHEVEQGIWRLHYKCIEEFRNRMRKSTAAATAAASAPAMPIPGVKGASTRRDSPQKVLPVFKSFLAEATGFYHNLISKLRAKHGLPQDYSPFESEPVGPAKDERRAAELKACDLSCHRCLIFLGDLARYKETHGDADVRSRDWSVAAGYYQQAISLWPSSGNPHNQLAVLATYVGDELLAVYRYFRSLAVDNPFLTARDNLIILFEKNRNHYAQLPMREAAASGADLDDSRPSDKKSTKGDRILPVGDGVLKLAVKDHNLESASSGELRKSFRIRFVRLNGILFTKTSLETFAEVYAATVRELETLLSPDDARLEAGLGLDHRNGIGTGSGGAAGFLQLIAILIFTVHNINWGLDSHHPTYAEILQRSALFQHAFTAAFECAGRLMRRCADFKDIAKSPLLPAMLVFLEWLACRPEMAAGSDVDEKQANARVFFWRQTVTLLNSCNFINKIHGDIGLDGAANGFEDEETSGGFALWEDYELRGFVSVLPAQVTLDYSRRAPRAGLGDKKERTVRVQRLWAAGKAIANALEGTEKGIIYDEDLKKFYMVGDVREEKVQGTEVSAGLDDIGSLPNEIVEELEKSTVAAWLTESVVGSNSTVTSSGPFREAEEEDEEVIVFKPIVKDVQVLTSAPDPVWKDVVGAQNAAVKSFSIIPGSGDLVGPASNRKAPVAVPNEQQRVPMGFDAKQFATDGTSGHLKGPDVVMGSKGQESSTTNGRFADSSTSSLSTTMSSVSGVHVFKKDGEIGGGKGAYGYAPSSAEEWLNQIARSSGAFPSSTLVPWDGQSNNIFGNGSEKSPGTAGVIGQPKQVAASNSLWSTSLDSLSLPGFSSLALGNSDFNGRQGGQLGGILPQSTTSLDSLLQASTKETNGPSHTTFSVALTSNGMAHGDEYVNSSRNGTPGFSYVQSTSGFPATGRRSPFVEPQVDKSVSGVSKHPSLTNGPTLPATPTNGAPAKDNALPSARLSGMRPPPGFGPLPANPLTNNVPKGTSQSASQPLKSALSDEREDQQVDDYGWLDDYSQKRNTGQAPYYQGQGSSLYSSDYGIWSNGSTNDVSKTPVSKTPTTYPFPGMGISEQDQLEKQRQRYSAQLLQQLLQQQQKYDGHRVDYGMEQQQMNYGVQPFEYDSQQQYQMKQQQFLLQQQQQEEEHQQQQQQQQKLWRGQYNTWDPFVS